MTKLIETIKSGNLEEVKQEYLRNKSSLNTEDEFYQIRPIDYAAQLGHLAILDYLITQGASLSTNPKRRSLLYCFMKPANSKSRMEINEWIQGNQTALLALDPTLTSEHLKAFLGEEADWNSRQEHGGLLPFHYGILRENPYARKRLIDLAGQPLPQNGWFKSYSFPLLLAENNRSDILKEMADNTISIDLDWEYQVDHPHFGSTVAWLLASYREWGLLKELATKNPVIALNAGPKHNQHPNYRLTLASILAEFQQWTLLEELTAKSVSIDLDAHTLNSGVTLAYLLALQNKWDLLNKSKSSIMDLDTGSKDEQHPGYGMTLAYILAYNRQWALLEELAAKSVTIDLNAAILKGPNQLFRGVTLAYLLAQAQKWDLLKKSKSPLLI